MGRRISCMFLGVCMIFVLPIFSFGANAAQLPNSGSAYSVRAMNEDDIALAAEVAAADGSFGYEISPYSVFNVYNADTSTRSRVGLTFTVPENGSFLYGEVSIDSNFSMDINDIFARNQTTNIDVSSSLVSVGFISQNTAFFTFDLSGYSVGDRIAIAFYDVSSFGSQVVSSFVDVSYPVPGVSSGFTYSSGIIDREYTSKFVSDIDFSFGSQPAGKYLINIYHWGDSYIPNFFITDESSVSNDTSIYFPVFNSNGVSTFVYNHVGGEMSFNGAVSLIRDNTGTYSGDVFFDNQNAFGDLVFNLPLSWTFNISDIVAIPYEQAGDQHFGPFSIIIGFFRDLFSSLHSFIDRQIDRLAGDDEAQSDVDAAQGSLDQEAAELGELSDQLDSYTSDIENQFNSDFAIPSEVTDQADTVQSIWTGLFSSFGLFSVFLWLPPLLAVIRHLLRL